MPDRRKTPGRRVTDKLLGEWFWTDRWMGSSAFLLPIEPRGLYREMLTQAWLRGARLPNDHDAIQRAVGCTLKEWTRCWPKIAKYWKVDGDMLVNETQLEVWAESKAAQETSSKRGSTGARARWGKRDDSTSNARADAQASPEQSPPDLDQYTQPERSPAVCAPPRDTPTGMNPSWRQRNDHMRHAFCGVVCLPAPLFRSFLQRMGQDEPKLALWLRATSDTWQKKVDAGETIAEGDDFDFWRARWDESFGSERRKDERRQGERRVESAEETDAYLKKFREDRAAVVNG